MFFFSVTVDPEHASGTRNEGGSPNLSSFVTINLHNLTFSLAAREGKSKLTKPTNECLATKIFSQFRDFEKFNVHSCDLSIFVLSNLSSSSNQSSLTVFINVSMCCLGDLHFFFFCLFPTPEHTEEY